jgi:hypothetical protein
LNRLLKKLFRVKAVEREPDPVLLRDVEPAVPPDNELEARLLAGQRRLAREISTYEETAHDARMTLAGDVLALRRR